MNFDDQLLEAKKDEFIVYVEQACNYYGFKKSPRIEFVEGYVSHGTKALAEIDCNNWIMYVSLIHLRDMPQFEMKKVAFHEVTHLLEHSHGPKFQQKLNDAISTTWIPDSTSGLTMINGGKRNKIMNLDSKSEPTFVHTHKRIIKITNIFDKPEKNCRVKLMDSFAEEISSNIFEDFTNENGIVVFDAVPEGIYIQRICLGEKFFEEIVELIKDDDIVIKPKTANKIESTFKLQNFIGLPLINCQIEITRIDDDFYDNPIKFSEITNNEGIANFKDIFDGKYFVCFLRSKKIIELTNGGLYNIKIPYFEKEDRDLDENLKRLQIESRDYKIVLVEEFIEKFKNLSKTDYCDYHLCREKKELHQCPFCKNWYCDKHYRPTQPYSLNFNDAKEFEKWKELTKSPFHPCTIYADYLHRYKK